MAKKIALYCRVSTGNQSTGLEAQVRLGPCEIIALEITLRTISFMRMRTNQELSNHDQLLIV